MTGQRRLGQKVVAERSGGRTATGNTTPSAGGACGKEGTGMGPGVALGWPCVRVCLRLGGQRALSGCPQLRGGLSLQEGGWLVCTRSRSRWLPLSCLSTETRPAGRRAQQLASPHLSAGAWRLLLGPCVPHTLTEGSCV